MLGFPSLDVGHIITSAFFIALTDITVTGFLASIIVPVDVLRLLDIVICVISTDVKSSLSIISKTEKSVSIRIVIGVILIETLFSVLEIMDKLDFTSDFNFI